ncbi:TrmH family RNA methyltransferase [Deinococcus pimensis]|uniref:TrmH family RNA methyltransferase n=1 Tax=Deinococcus pimensis TaxID=309888 RepID=UPI0004816BBC|nr:RNA methyltransferase [Deinococcus pimensis]
MRELTSPQNPEIKATARLRERRDREREGRFLIEGTREVARALLGGVPVERLYVCEDLLRGDARDVVGSAQAAGAELVLVSRAAFAKLSARENPDGVLGVAPLPARTLPPLPQDALVLVLVGLEKPGNLGALLRTADGVGVDAVVLAGRGVDLFNPNVIRASQGSVFTQSVVTMEEDAALAWLRAEGFELFALAPEGSVTYWAADLTARVALALGTEHEGLPPAWEAAADQNLRIPMRGGADSLNVATAGALVLYEALRQRG